MCASSDMYEEREEEWRVEWRMVFLATTRVKMAQRVTYLEGQFT